MGALSAQLATTDRRRDRVPAANPAATIAATGVLVLASFAFRLPPLLNAGATNSDAAVVGLQAMHLLRGQLSAFLWGSGYQTSADSFVAAAAFAPFGPSPLALMLSALSLHVLATWFVFRILLRRFDAWTALLVTLPLIFSPSTIHSYALYPPRQLSLTLAIAALWAIDAATTRLASRMSSAWLSLGGLLYGLAISADPYAVVLGPVILGYALAVTFEHPREHLPWLGTGTLAGIVPFGLMHQSMRSTSKPLLLTTSALQHNWDLLVRECLPWALSYKVYAPRHQMAWAPWVPPVAIQVVQLMGAFIVAGIVCIGLVTVAKPRMPWSTRRLGFMGALTYPTTIGAFLASVMVMDHFSMRYLATLTLLLPIASIPAATLFGARRFAILMAPHLVASALCGWVGYGPFARGIVPVVDTTQVREDASLFELLKTRGIRHAQADYWVSYRLTFLAREQVIVVPTNLTEDRYPPYRQAFDGASSYAYIFDPSRSREDVQAREQELLQSSAHVDKVAVGRLTVFIVERRKPPTPPTPPT